MSTTNQNKTNDIITITAADMPKIIESHADRLTWSLANKGHRRGLTTPLFLALPGVGKSEISRHVADTMDRNYYDVRAGSYLPSDVRIPAIDRERNSSRYYGNEDFPFVSIPDVNADDAICINWEELLDASLPMFKMCKQAMNDNSIGNLFFPENTLHIAVANGLDHGCMSERMPLSNANRLSWYEVKPDMTSFQEWLSDVGLYPELEAFMQSNNDVPYDLDVAKWDGKSNFASFRTLEELGKLINTDLMEVKGDQRYMKPLASDPLLKAKLNALLGYKACNKAFEFLHIYEAVGSIDNLLNDPTGCDIPSEMNKKWIVACKLAGTASKSNLDAVMTVAERLSGKKGFMGTYVAKSICKQKPALQSEPRMRKWMGDNFSDLCGR